MAALLRVPTSRIVRAAGFAVRPSHARFLTAGKAWPAEQIEARSKAMDNMRRGFARVQRAEREANETELVASAEEVIQNGENLLGLPLFDSEPSVQLELKQKIGLAHFKLPKSYSGRVGGEHGTHFQRGLGYLEQVAQARGSLLDWFNVMTVAACAGDVQRSQAAFIKLEERYDDAETPPAELRAFYPWPEVLHYHACALRDGGFYLEALSRVETLRDAYQQLHVTDPEFLRMRGMVIFQNFLRLATSVLDPLPGIDSNEWLRELAQHVDREGQQSIDSIRSRV